jgi:hypothetical protein
LEEVVCGTGLGVCAFGITLGTFGTFGITLGTFGITFGTFGITFGTFGITFGTFEKLKSFLKEFNQIKEMFPFFEIQFCLKNLPVPKDVAEEIKSFLYYDKITGNTRIHKKEMVKVIDDAPYSRKGIPTEDGESIPIPDSDGLWVFCSADINAIQFQARNCVTCGNYNMSYVECEKTRCLCIEDYDEVWIHD